MRSVQNGTLLSWFRQHWVQAKYHIYRIMSSTGSTVTTSWLSSYSPANSSILIPNGYTVSYIAATDSCQPAQIVLGRKRPYRRVIERRSILFLKDLKTGTNRKMDATVEKVNKYLASKYGINIQEAIEIHSLLEKDFKELLSLGGINEYQSNS